MMKYDVTIMIEGVDENFDRISLTKIPSIGQGFVIEYPTFLAEEYYNELDRQYPDIKMAHDARKTTPRETGIPIERLEEFERKEHAIDDKFKKYEHLMDKVFRVIDVIYYVGEIAENEPSYLIRLQEDKNYAGWGPKDDYRSVELPE